MTPPLTVFGMSTVNNGPDVKVRKSSIRSLNDLLIIVASKKVALSPLGKSGMKNVDKGR